MGITSAIVLFAVVWFLTFFIVLPLRLETQGDVGAVVPGTHESAPSGAVVGRKARITTYFAVPIWAVLAFVILSGDSRPTIAFQRDLQFRSVFPQQGRAS